MRKLLLSVVALVAIAFGISAASQGVTVSGKVGNYTYVDLGLESGTKWATYNVGASKPSEYGDYFAWGETTPKEVYTWKTYKWSNGSFNTLIKYCVDTGLGTVDYLTTLLAEDDAATANWGEGWRMPTHAEQHELMNDCNWEWTDDFNGSGVAGQIGTSKVNGNTIFLPAAGYRSVTGFNCAGRYGYYWSSWLCEYSSNCAFSLMFDFHDVGWDYYYRRFGRNVRAVVRETDTMKSDTTKIDNVKSDTTGTYVHEVTISGQVGNYTYVDLGLANGTKWATYNVGATQPTDYGDYFAWGETTPKTNYSWKTYKWCKGSNTTLTKYCVDSKYGTVDSLTTLLAEDDAATANWGESWRMPTRAEQDELRNGCDWEWTDNFNGSGVAGRIGTSKANSNTIFLPAAGCRYGSDLDGAGYYGSCWSSSLYESCSSGAYELNFGSCYIDLDNYGCYFGYSVRAVVK